MGFGCLPIASAAVHFCPLAKGRCFSRPPPTRVIVGGGPDSKNPDKQARAATPPGYLFTQDEGTSRLKKQIFTVIERNQKELLVVLLTCGLGTKFSEKNYLKN